ncbi:hypothetical protein PR001_g31684 [Phytophthora rubi]|uniref:Uncharacterized protein n=1 Tax=Phytophthora rubi TaxID=129364 RepID=A0A6A3GDR4_9STRA|nr:hypothetical protein PR001_g31684 [Phytophthora rubi]
MISAAVTRVGTCCKFEDYDSQVLSKGHYYLHGGSKPCKVRDCGKRSQSKDFCFTHGVGTCCKFEDYERQVLSKGICYLHGGSKRSKVKGCEKRAKSNDLCCGHESSARCKFEDC